MRCRFSTADISEVLTIIIIRIIAKTDYIIGSSLVSQYNIQVISSFRKLPSGFLKIANFILMSHLSHLKDSSTSFLEGE